MGEILTGSSAYLIIKSHSNLAEYYRNDIFMGRSLLSIHTASEKVQLPHQVESSSDSIYTWHLIIVKMR